jgi:UDP-N-acetylmuramate: L-alanyl-gamma-D-glutamyl-meso-diaminopimelate ligase
LLNIVPRNGMVLLNADDPNCSVLARENWQAPVDEVGFSKNAAVRIRDAAYDGAGSRFTLFDTEFTLALTGECNVRNAAMAIAAAKFYGVPVEAIRKAVAEFAGVKRRQEVRGVAKGITVVDDFGHHPTAIRETLVALRHRFPKKRLWAVFEPRSNTTRRAVFQDELPKAFDLADGVLISQVARLEQLPEQDRLNPEKVVATIAKTGKPAFYEPDVTAIIARIKTLASEPDVIVVFSNGGFGNIHERLLNEL